jgi:hypothetical protein
MFLLSLKLFRFRVQKVMSLNPKKIKRGSPTFGVPYTRLSLLGEDKSSTGSGKKTARPHTGQEKGQDSIRPRLAKTMVAVKELGRAERLLKAGLCLVALCLVGYNVAPTTLAPDAVSDSAVAYFAAPKVHHIDSNRSPPAGPL